MESGNEADPDRGLIRPLALPCLAANPRASKGDGNSTPHEDIVPLAKEITVEAIGQNRPKGTIHMVATTTLLRSRKAGRAQVQMIDPKEQNAKDETYDAGLSKHLDIEIMRMGVAVIIVKPGRNIFT